MRSPYIREDLKVIALVALVAVGFLLLCITMELGAIAMRKIKIAAASFTALTLAACGTTGNPDLAKQALGNLEHCERTYQASVGSLGTPGGSLFIRCPAKPFEPVP